MKFTRARGSWRFHSVQLFTLFCLFGILTFRPLHAAPIPFKVLVDPGHGGVDTGAVVGSLKESDIALKIALALKRRLAKNEQFQVKLTREQDKALSLQDRVDFADQVEADLFLSIHANASPDPRAKGVEFYFQNQMNPDEESLFLAAHEHSIEKSAQAQKDASTGSKNDNDVLAIVEDLKRQDRQRSSYKLAQQLARTWKNSGTHHSRMIRQAPFYVISKTERPAVLVEVGFVTHASEGPRLSRRDYQEEVAERIYRSLVAYRESLSTSFNNPMPSPSINPRD